MLSFSISNPDLIKISYFVDTTLIKFLTLWILLKEGIGGKRRGEEIGGEREGDFMDNSIS
jgi:hypothetical protein